MSVIRVIVVQDVGVVVIKDIGRLVQDVSIENVRTAMMRSHVVHGIQL